MPAPHALTDRSHARYHQNSLIRTCHWRPLSERSPLHTHILIHTMHSALASTFWQTTGLCVSLVFNVCICTLACLQSVMCYRGGEVSACKCARGRVSLQKKNTNVCVRHSVSCQALRLHGSKVHQAGRLAGRRCCGLIECWFRPAGREHSGFLNHSTNAFIHLQNSAINFGAGVRTFGEIWPVIASQSHACSFSHSKCQTGIQNKFQG